MNQGAFLMKGLDNVRAEFSLTALVYNLRRALNILGVEATMLQSREASDFRLLSHEPSRQRVTTNAATQP
jgi:two-component SAPR family response regulator